MLDQSYYRKTDEIIEHYGRKAASLIPIMQDIQAEYRYLPGRRDGRHHPYSQGGEREHHPSHRERCDGSRVAAARTAARRVRAGVGL